MLTLPPIQSWQAIHPLIVHFPIVLLLVAPIFIVIGAALKPERSFPYLLTALILMTLGTVSAWAAASSGEAAGEAAGMIPSARAVLEQHEDLAELTDLAFSTLTLIFGCIVFIPRFLGRENSRAISTVLPLVFLIFYAAGAVSLANTAHQGGVLVHELGVRAQIQSGAVAAEYTPQSEDRE